MPGENRISQRRKVHQYAIICGNDGSIIGRCVMADVSATGAKLILQVPADVPDDFVLILSRDGLVRRRCEVAWRSELRLGIKFVRDPSVAANQTGVH